MYLPSQKICKEIFKSFGKYFKILNKCVSEEWTQPGPNNVKRWIVELLFFAWLIQFLKD